MASRGTSASAGKAATELIRKHDLSWWEVLEGRALGRKAAAEVRRSDLGIDYLQAAESRIRQLKAHNQMLEKQVAQLKEKIEAQKAALRRESD